jgi:hypothetical protein
MNHLRGKLTPAETERLFSKSVDVVKAHGAERYLWVHGYLIKEDVICDPSWRSLPDEPNEFKIQPETVGLYAHRIDRNNLEIYEHDIVRVIINGIEYKAVVVVDPNVNDESKFTLASIGGKPFPDNPQRLFHIFPKNVEVIGNKFDGIDPAYIQSIPLTVESLEPYIAAANIAGYMEKADKIFLNSDTELAGACIELVDAYNKLLKDDPFSAQDFSEFAGGWLLDKFQIEQTATSTKEIQK